MQGKVGPRVAAVAVIGTGLIGASWAALFLSKGLAVHASDPAAGAEDRLRSFVDRALPDLRRLDPGAVMAADGLSFTSDPREGAARADFIQESVPEDLDLKRSVLSELEDAARPATVIASSTTAFRPSELQTGCRRPERIVVGHPFNPPHLMPLVEVVGGRLTAPEAIERAFGFYRSIGKTPIRLRREVVGHVANRLAAALWREAVHMVAEGVASVADIDRAVTDGPGLRWAALGPNLLYHLGGGAGGMATYLERLGPTQEARWQSLGEPRLTEAVKKQLIDGVRDEAAGRSVEELAHERDDALIEILLLRDARRRREAAG
jgi:3-hydroxyacyl-CoA dehydrogenase